MDWKELQMRARSSAIDIARKSSELAEKLAESELANKARDTATELGLHGKRAAVEAKDWAQEKYVNATEPTNARNWYQRAAMACETASDAILRERSGTSTKISRGVAAKLGAASTTAGIFSIAALIGSASTGTAIGSLSGAAFTSAALAWVGGSVVMGSLVIGVAAVAGGLGAAFGAAWVSKKYLWGQKRQRSELEEQERRVLDACLALAAAFREKSKLGDSIDPVSAKHLYAEALAPLCEELLDISNKVNSWPYVARHRLESAAANLLKISRYLAGWSKDRPNITTGVVGAVLIRLLADDLDSFNQNEQLVLDALRRSKASLSEVSNRELAEYVQSLEPSQLQGLQNNVKGIYHELRFAQIENTDDDEYIAELFEATNHPGADIKITNLETGEVRKVQLKATNYLSLIRKHNEKYASTDVFATFEVADMSPDVESTGLSNAEITEETQDVISDLDGYSEGGVLSSMAVAGMITLARNVRVLLKGETMSQAERQKLVADGAVSAGVAGLMTLLLG